MSGGIGWLRGTRGLSCDNLEAADVVLAVGICWTGVERFSQFELAGDPVRVRSNFVGGLKHLPVRYQLH